MSRKPFYFSNGYLESHVLARVWENFVEHFGVSSCRKHKKSSLISEPSFFIPTIFVHVPVYEDLFELLRVNFNQWITMSCIKNWPSLKIM